MPVRPPHSTRSSWNRLAADAIRTVLAFLSLGLALGMGGKTINYDINTAASGNYSGTAVAPDAGTFWNSGLISGTSATNLLLSVKDSTGTVVPNAVIYLSKSGGSNMQAESAATPGSPNPLLLMQDYTHSGNYEMVVGGLEAATYLLYVFAHGDAVGKNATVTLDAANLGLSGTTGATGEAYRDLLAPGAEGYAYLKFDDVPVGTDGVLKFTVSNYLNGFQLVKKELPVILTQPPATVTGFSAASTSIAIEASGPATMTYQWQKSTDGGAHFDAIDAGANASAATPTLFLDPLETSDAGLYRVVLTTQFGSVTSTSTELSVETNPAPLFSLEPANQQVGFGESVTFTASAFAPSGVSYQWFHDGIAIPGATSASYTLPSIGPGDTGVYTVEATNAFGSLRSAPATLTLSLPAFPGADGPGADASGGRHAEVYHVTNLDDDIANPPPGSLRHALTNIPPGGRTVVFDVSGLIFLDPASGTQGWLKSGANNLTVAGQTAPAPGITIAGQGTKFSGDNVILRHFKIRPGKHQVDPGLSTYDGLSNYLQNSIVDHLSISWADDESLSSTDLVEHTTVQYCLVGEALYYALEGGKTHAYGALINSEVPNAPLSYHHNLFAHIQSRLPRIQAEIAPGMILNWSNNVVYNWRGNAAYTGNGEPTRTNFIGNYYIAGANTRSTDRTFYSPDTATVLYLADNYRDMDKDGQLDGSLTAGDTFVGGPYTAVGSPFAAVGVPQLDTPGTSVETVTARVGAFWWSRDAVDTRLIHDTLNQTGQFVTDPSDVGGWETTSAARPAGFDRDRDGMSDAWEAAHGLNPLVADGTGDVNGDGYTNLDNYLNDLGAFPLLRPSTWQGGEGRYSDPIGWPRWWQPSRFDPVVIGGDATVTIDAPGNWAGSVQLDPGAGATTAVAITNGWWQIAGDVETGGAGHTTITQTGGIVRIDGTLHLDAPSATATYTLSGGTLFAHAIELGTGGSLLLNGGRIHAGAIAAASVSLAGARLAPGTDAAVEALAGALGDRALVPPVASTIGTTAVTGDLDLTGATLELELAAADQFDRVTVSGELVLGGELEILSRDGYKPALGTQFTIALAETVTGAFADVTPGYAVSQPVAGEVVVTYLGNILTYDDWAAEQPFEQPEDALPGADPENDGWTNLEEFAFIGQPLVADRPFGLPALETAGAAAFIIPEGATLLRFSHRPSSDLTYLVEVSDDLENWSEYWTTDEGWDAAVVQSHVPGPVFETVSLYLSPNDPLPEFARVRVELSEALVLLEPLGLTGAEDVPTDLPPSLVFNRPVHAGTTGAIRLFKADGTLLSTVDLGANPRRQVGNDPLNYYPVTTNRHVAMLLFDRNLMTNGTTYYVTIDPGVIRDSAGEPWGGVSDDQTLRFTTRATSPSSSATQLTVDWDGTGDFCTVQGALEHIGSLLPHRVTIEVADGSYEELVYVSNQRGPVTIRGESRAGTVLHYANNANFNSSRASFRNRANDLTVENLTLINTTPKGGSQAEAFMSQGERVVVRNCDLSSFQDTVRVDKSAFFEDCFIEGDVDFIWGDGVAYFDRCILHNRAGGYVVQARNEETGHGFIFNECLLTAEPGVSNVYLARIDPTAYPFSEVVFLHCAMGNHLAPVGWQLNGASSAPNLRFFEYASVDLNGTPLNVASRLAAATQLTPAQAAPFFDVPAILGFDPATR